MGDCEPEPGFADAARTGEGDEADAPADGQQGIERDDIGFAPDQLVGRNRQRRDRTWSGHRDQRHGKRFRGLGDLRVGGGEEAQSFRLVELQPFGQHAQGFRAGGFAHAAFHIADGARADARSLGQLFLTEPGAQAKGANGMREVRRRRSHFHDLADSAIRGRFPS